MTPRLETPQVVCGFLNSSALLSRAQLVGKPDEDEENAQGGEDADEAA